MKIDLGLLFWILLCYPLWLMVPFLVVWAHSSAGIEHLPY